MSDLVWHCEEGGEGGEERLPPGYRLSRAGESLWGIACM